MIFRSVFVLICFVQLQIAAPHSYAESRAESSDKLIASINSVEVAKNEIRSAMAESDNCPTGSCMDSWYTMICDIVAALDVNVAGKILDPYTMTGGESKFAISSYDVRHMKEIFAQCKPTNYQYWNHGELLHVVYRPDEKSSLEIDEYLGIE
ncbi:MULTISPECIES: hypothetical protein [unclassified Thiocapsa]|uniref:hypothetical protein n=1 Tax=unclassified Thiocapsa TaxID=2641286 RepID=UPI0035AE0CFE